jgi:hypothetical protein
MTSLRKTVARAMFVLLTTAAMAAANTTTPLPGTVNYVEGQATLNGESLPESSAGSVAVETNQVLDTAHGKAELLSRPASSYAWATTANCAWSRRARPASHSIW